MTLPTHPPTHPSPALFGWQDLHALDLPTLQWSEPLPKDPMPIPRAAHSVTVIPVRISVPIEGERAAVKGSPPPPPPGAPRGSTVIGSARGLSGAAAAAADDGPSLQLRNVDVGSLMKQLASQVAALGSIAAGEGLAFT